MFAHNLMARVLDDGMKRRTRNPTSGVKRTIDRRLSMGRNPRTVADSISYNSLISFGWRQVFAGPFASFGSPWDG
jgi:hypothetical protein